MSDRIGQSIRHMLNHAREAHPLTIGRSGDDLNTNRAFALQLTRLMEIVGEASRRVPGEFRAKYPGTDWRGFAGLRDVLIHKFDAIEHNTLWRIVQEELPVLIRQLEENLQNET